MGARSEDDPGIVGGSAVVVAAVTQVPLRPVGRDNLRAGLALRVGAGQADQVAANATSMAEAAVNPNLVPLAVDDVAARGWEDEIPVPMVGFAVSEVATGVGFILRLMIDERFHRRGSGRAAMVEVIRRLRLHPAVEMIATSHRRGNEAAAALSRSLGFVPGEIGWATETPDEVFLRLPD